MPKINEQKNILSPRPPIVTVMGHIDHGKSSLLDYIRKTNIVEKEAGGITQHIAAYEVVHKDKEGKERKITFLDTPGHEAFSAMRSRGGKAADISILVVSAEDGVKPQTVEALKSIKDANIPFIVAITKIDKPGANVERAKSSLMENEVYLEGFGGTVPSVSISSKTGEGIPDLLEMIFLVADLEDIKGSPEKEAEGVVIETNMDKAKGISASLIIKDGTLKKGMAILSEDCISPVRLMENFLGKKIDCAEMGSPVKVVGWDKIPHVGAKFFSYPTKKIAEAKLLEYLADKEKNKSAKKTESGEKNEGKVLIPIIVKADVAGTIEAIEHEIKKLVNDSVSLDIIYSGVGNINETDVKNASGNANSVVLGFNVPIDGAAKSVIDRLGVKAETFDIIYKLAEWLQNLVKEKTPKKMIEESKGKAKILKLFSKEKDKQIVGGRVLEGVISIGAELKITRRETEIGKGKIRELQQQKVKASEVQKGSEFGTMIQSSIEIAAGDIIEAYEVVEI
ncbi:MAG: translation initiation factor IF-2 [Candidatus Paceibacterota bacterium]